MDKTKKEPTDFLTLLTTRVTLGKRFSKTQNENIEKWHKDYNITTIKDGKFENLDNQIQIPYIFSTIESGVAAFFDKFPSIVMKQRGKEDRDFTNFAEQIWDYLKDKLSLEEVTEEAAMEFLTTGMIATRYGWNMETTEVEMPVTGPDGQPMVDPATGLPTMQKVSVPIRNYPYVCNQSYKTMFFSPESKFILDDDTNKIPYEYCVQTLTKDEVKAMYGKEPTEEELESIKLSDISEISPLESTSPEQDARMIEEMKRVQVYNYVGTLPEEAIPTTLKDSYLPSNVYYIAFTKKNVYKEAEQIAKKPVLLLGNYGLMDQFFRFGEAKVLRELEQDVSLGRSRIMDLRDRQGTKIGVPQGTEFDEVSFKKSRDYTFMRFMGNNPPLYINPPPLPETIVSAINMSRDDIQMSSAMMDISRAGDTNTVTTATGQKIFAGETNKRNARKKKKIARYLRALAKNLLILCGQNWDHDTFAKITDLPIETIMEMGWKEKLIDLGEEYDVDIDIDTMGDSKEQDAANAIALYREMKDNLYINQEELIKFTLKTGFQQKNSDQFMSGYVSQETILAVVKNLLETGIIQMEDAQMITQKWDAMQMEQQAMEQGGGAVGANEGRPPTANPVDIVKKGMPGTDTTQMSAQRSAAYKQTNVAKGPQMNRKG